MDLSTVESGSRSNERDLEAPRGCWVSVARCFWGKPKEDRTRYNRAATETIEFENLVTAENRAKEERAKKQLVTASEKEHVRTGQLDQLVEEQRRIDAEKDAELRRQEEALRLEEEAYYAAKREAARKSRQSSASPQGGRGKVTAETHPTSHPMATTTVFTNTTSLPKFSKDRNSTLTATTMEVKDEEEDFDQFLESVKARQRQITSGVSELSTVSSDEEVDFGYWEKAPLPLPSQGQRSEGSRKDVDLNLL